MKKNNNTNSASRSVLLPTWAPFGENNNSINGQVILLGQTGQLTEQWMDLFYGFAGKRMLHEAKSNQSVSVAERDNKSTSEGFLSDI